MEYRDYYAALGVDKKASQADIKKAFRKLAREHHPDVNKGDSASEKRFKEVSEANEVLSDPEKRRNYDEFGQISLDSGFDAEAARRAKASFGRRFGGAGSGGFGGGFAEDFSFGDLDDMFGRIFTRRGGGASRPPRPQHGRRERTRRRGR